MDGIMLIYLLIIILLAVKSDGNETKDNTNSLPSIFISTTALHTTETLKTTLTENISTVSSNVNLTPFTTEHSTSQMRTGTAPIEQQNTLTTTPYSITPNVTENFTNFSTVVPMSTVNNSTLPSSKPNNISHSDDASSISTQSDIETHSDNSALKLSTASIDSSGLSTFGITEKTNGNSTLDQSTKMIGQKNKSSVTTYQPTDTTIHHESGKADILNPSTDKIDVLTVTGASASTVIVIISLIVFLVKRKRKQTKCQSRDNKRNGDYELAMEVTSYRSPTVWTDFRSYDNPWDSAPCEYHIPSEVDNMYHSLDFTVRSHVAPKFAGEDNYSVVNIANNKQKGEHFTKSKNAMFELKDIGDKSSRNLQKAPIFNQSRPTKTTPSEETVAYCDTAIVHQEFLYDVPKHSIIDGVRHSNKEGETNNFTANQRAVTIFPSKEINQVISTRISKDKKENAMESFKDKLNMSLSRTQFRQPNAYPVNPFPMPDTAIYSFAK